MCIGLRSKQYCYRNEQYTKEKYQEILGRVVLDTWSGSEKARKDFESFILAHPHKYANIMNSVDCTGDYLVNSKNAKHCYITVRVENSKYFERGDTIKDSYDCLSGGEQELCYDSINPDNSYRALFTSYCHKDRDVTYSDSCQSSEELFGCVGLKSAKYCILNKQYPKEEYLNLKNRLIEHMKQTGEWGEFFPASLSPFSYNESVAQDEFPLTREDAVDRGFRWQEGFTKTKGRETLKDIPDNISDVTDAIVNDILVCATCRRNYRITGQELGFYRHNKIPIPRECFFCRLAVLYRERGPVRLWKRKCMCPAGHQHGDAPCPTEFETSYSPDCKEIVYCEQCYNAEVV
jgi:hypothetical protein